MSHSPDPQQTASGPAYEGRLLARPEDEDVDQGAAFDARTLFSRRCMLSVMGIGAGTLTLAACGADGTTSTSAITSTTGSATTSTGEIPEETNGPYPADGTQGLNILEQSGIERRTSVPASTAARPTKVWL